MKNIFNSIRIASENIKANPLHTFLSIIGIVIGVAALVAVLALGDGLEETGREQVENTTSIKNISVAPKRYQTINSIRVDRDTVEQLTFADLISLKQQIDDQASVELYTRFPEKVTYRDSLKGVLLYGGTDNGYHFLTESLTGRYFQEDDIETLNHIAVVNKSFLNLYGIQSDNALNTSIQIKGKAYQIIGVHEAGQSPPSVYIPITNMAEIFKEVHPSFNILANEIEDVITLKKEIENWLENRFEQGAEAFTIGTYEGRARQFEEGVLLFKLIMGAITGISVLVGGIGIMNVLLISVTERTKEIGIRKAVGAKKKDIVFQFLSESVTISIIGCALGWLAGIVGIMAFIPIVNSITDISFHAAIGGESIFVIVAVALFVGVVFGTYPAWRAANLTPVDAIRHE